MEIPKVLIETLRTARRVTALTGAGISAESGVPTFRDAQTGLWARYRPEELATPEAFSRNPRLVWDWYTTWQDTGEAPPRCPRCGGLLRPDVVWFGEALPGEALEAAIEAAQSCDVFFSVGTSSVVEPAASLPYEALRYGATVVEVNPNETLLTSRATFVLRGLAGEVLPALVGAVWPESQSPD